MGVVSRAAMTSPASRASNASTISWAKKAASARTRTVRISAGSLAQASSRRGSVTVATCVLPGWKLPAHTSRVMPSKQSKGRYDGRPCFFGLNPIVACSWWPYTVSTVESKSSTAWVEGTTAARSTRR